jgi:hypothetical protein
VDWYQNLVSIAVINREGRVLRVPLKHGMNMLTDVVC